MQSKLASGEAVHVQIYQFPGGTPLAALKPECRIRIQLPIQIGIRGALLIGTVAERIVITAPLQIAQQDIAWGEKQVGNGILNYPAGLLIRLTGGGGGSVGY